MTRSQDPAADGDRLGAGHADREQPIDIVQQGRLTGDGLGTRASRAVALARRRPLVRAAAGSGLCLVIAFAATRVFAYAEPGGPNNPTGYHSWALPCLFLAVAAVLAAVFIAGYGVGSSIEQKRSRKRPPPSRSPGTV